MQIKLETQRGEAVHTAETAFDNDPPDVVLWAGRTFRFMRTDGIFDQKKHVYREASVHDLGDAPIQTETVNGADHSGVNGNGAAATDEASSKGKKKDDRQISAVLTTAQAALLKRVKTQGAYSSPKQAILAGLEALDEKHAMSNDALLKLLAERLDTRH